MSKATGSHLEITLFSRVVMRRDFFRHQCPAVDSHLVDQAPQVVQTIARRTDHDLIRNGTGVPQSPVIGVPVKQ